MTIDPVAIGSFALAALALWFSRRDQGQAVMIEKLRGEIDGKYVRKAP